jgi:hypothetical protein
VGAPEPLRQERFLLWKCPRSNIISVCNPFLIPLQISNQCWSWKPYIYPREMSDVFATLKLSRRLKSPALEKLECYFNDNPSLEYCSSPACCSAPGGFCKPIPSLNRIAKIFRLTHRSVSISTLSYRPKFQSSSVEPQIFDSR